MSHNKFVHNFLNKYPPKILKTDNMPGSVADYLEDIIEEYIEMYSEDIFLDTNKLDPKKVIKHIEDNLECLFDSIIEYNECGATLMIMSVNKMKSSHLNKECIYKLLWSDYNISERYGSDFVFDINDFGYEYFVWNKKYYLVGGIPG